MSGIHLFEYPKSVHISGRHVAIACLDKHHGLSVIEIYCHLSYVIQYFRSLLIIKSCNFVQKTTRSALGYTHLPHKFPEST